MSRLENIKQMVESEKKNNGNYLSIRDMEWLVEQAEQVKELKNKVAIAQEGLESYDRTTDGMVHDYEKLKEKFWHLNDANKKLDKDNERYRKALEYYAKEEHYEMGEINGVSYERLVDRGEIARHSLEGEHS